MEQYPLPNKPLAADAILIGHPQAFFEESIFPLLPLADAQPRRESLVFLDVTRSIKIY